MAFASMPLSYKRLYAGALDEDSVFESLESAKAYAAGPTSYAGQVIGVKTSNNEYKSYIINADKSLNQTLTMEDITEMFSWTVITNN